MNSQPKLVLPGKNNDELDLSSNELVFLFNGNIDNCLVFPFQHKNLFEYLGFQIIRSPNKLINHIQRIFYCFQESLPDQLYASILDLIFVLQGRGTELSQRMFNGSKSILRPDDREILEMFYRNSIHNENILPVNRFSVLAKGLIGSPSLIVCHEKSMFDEHNPLILAQHFIEYSQLEEARAVLEKAVVEDPDNKPLHAELLELYKSTRNFDAFHRIYTRLQKQKSSMIHLWEDFETLNTEINNEG